MRIQFYSLLFIVLLSGFSFFVGTAFARIPAPDPLPTVVKEVGVVGTCKIGGCSSQLCVDINDSGMSTCEWREEYACYRGGICERQANGQCGWTMTDELRSCLADTGSIAPTIVQPTNIPAPTATTPPPLVLPTQPECPMTVVDGYAAHVCPTLPPFYQPQPTTQQPTGQQPTITPPVPTSQPQSEQQKEKKLNQLEPVFFQAMQNGKDAFPQCPKEKLLSLFLCLDGKKVRIYSFFNPFLNFLPVHILQ